MIGHLPEHATTFAALFARVEHTLRRNGYAQPNKDRAMVDWRKFARELGEDFFAHVRDFQHSNRDVVGQPTTTERGKQDAQQVDARMSRAILTRDAP
jgi:hypothetical protein